MTTGTKLARPRFETPTEEYDRESQDHLIRTLELVIDALENPGPMRGNSLTITGIPGHGGGLRDGDVFQLDGVLNITRPNVAYAGTLKGTGACGDITVTVA